MAADDEPEPRPRRADAWIVAVGAVAVTYAAVALAPVPVGEDPTASVLTQVLLALAVGAGALVLFRHFSPDATGALVALCTGLFLAGGAAVILGGSPFGPLGVVADQSYRTAYLTKFGHTWELVDYAYKDLPSFYPPLYFWVLGRAATVLGVAPWEMLKVGMLIVAFVVPTGGWLLWRPAVGPRRAAVVVVVTSLVFQEWYVPQLWLAIVVFVPWWLHWVLGAGRPAGLARARRGLAVGIALGVVVALTYWYLLLVGLVHLAGVGIARSLAGTRARPSEPRSWREARVVLGGVVVVTAFYWIPLAISFFSTPGARTMQNRYFTADEVSLPLPFLSFDLEGLVLLAGLVTLVATARTRAVARYLLGLLGAAYALYLVGYLAFLAGNPLDTIRTVGLIEFVLAAGAALGAAEVWRVVTAGRLDGRLDRVTATSVVVVTVVVVGFAFGQQAVRDMPFLAEQRDAEYPTRLIAGFERATDGDYADAVVLTDITDLSAFLPTYVFNTSNEHYSHPSALFGDRADLLTALGREDDPEAFAIALLHNRYDAVDLVALRADGDTLTYSWLADAFPNGVAARSVGLRTSQFSDDAFVELDGSELTVYRVDRSRDPLRSLRDCPRRPDRDRCAVLGRLLDGYEPHLDDDAQDLARRWSARR
jgi:hypothetical protein